MAEMIILESKAGDEERANDGWRMVVTGITLSSLIPLEDGSFYCEKKREGYESPGQEE